MIRRHNIPAPLSFNDYYTGLMTLRLMRVLAATGPLSLASWAGACRTGSRYMRTCEVKRLVKIGHARHIGPVYGAQGYQITSAGLAYLDSLRDEPARSYQEWLDKRWDDSYIEWRRGSS